MMALFTLKDPCLICGGLVQVYADAENGSSPDDVYDDPGGVCTECHLEEGYAVMDSECLAHHEPMGSCHKCFEENLEHDHEGVMDYTLEACRGGKRPFTFSLNKWPTSLGGGV